MTDHMKGIVSDRDQHKPVKAPNLIALWVVVGIGALIVVLVALLG